jgi:hypothetical protein
VASNSRGGVLLSHLILALGSNTAQAAAKTLDRVGGLRGRRPPNARAVTRALRKLEKSHQLEEHAAIIKSVIRHVDRISRGKKAAQLAVVRTFLELNVEFIDNAMIDECFSNYSPEPF